MFRFQFQLKVNEGDKLKKRLEMYRSFNKKIEELLDVTHKVEFYYFDNSGNKYNLLTKEEYNKKIILSNEDDSWDFSEKGMGMSGSITIGFSSVLFGNSGIVNTDAEIGVALEWQSKQSLKRHIIPISVITYQTRNNVNIPFELYFNKEDFFGEIDLSIIIFLKKTSVTPLKGEATIVGTVLGELIGFTVILDGLGSTFPIVIVDEPNKPLWNIIFNYSEPLLEPFNIEYITIYINKSHNGFKHLHSPKSNLDKLLYVEFLASVLQLIIQNVMESPYWNSIKSGIDFEEESIGEVIYYFITTFNLDLDTPEKMAYSIRLFLDQKVKVGEF